VPTARSKFRVGFSCSDDPFTFHLSPYWLDKAPCLAHYQLISPATCCRPSRALRRLGPVPSYFPLDVCSSPSSDFCMHLPRESSPQPATSPRTPPETALRRLWHIITSHVWKDGFDFLSMRWQRLKPCSSTRGKRHRALDPKSVWASLRCSGGVFCLDHLKGQSPDSRCPVPSAVRPVPKC